MLSFVGANWTILRYELRNAQWLVALTDHEISFHRLRCNNLGGAGAREKFIRLRTACLLIVALASACFPNSTFGQSAPPPGNANTETESPAPSGLKVSFSYYGDTLANVSGGLRTGSTYEGRLGVIVDLNLADLFGWNGATAHASVHEIHGMPITPGRVDALSAVSGLEAEPAERLFNLWVEQKIGQHLNVRAGQFTAAQEFIISDNAAFFINSTFGWPTIASQDLPSGGPAYPLATPGLRINYTIGKRAAILVAIFNGDAAGPGLGDPQQRDADGLNSFRISGPPFLIGELQHGFWGIDSDPRTKVRLGYWAYLGSVSDQRYTAQGLSIGNPLGSGVPARRQGDYQIYAVVDQKLFEAGIHKLSGFARIAFSPSNRNLVNSYGDAGLDWSGFLQKRPSDTVGVAVGVSILSNGPPGGNGFHEERRRAETVLELSYRAQIKGYWYVQPDVQFIAHPGASVQAATTAEPSSPTPDAVVVGVRNVLQF